MTLNQILFDIVYGAIITLLGFVIRMYVIPYLQNHHLAQVAKILVRAAEAIYGAGHGKDKLQYCIDQVQEKYHIKVDYDLIYNAIQAAWLELDASQQQIADKPE